MFNLNAIAPLFSLNSSYNVTLDIPQKAQIMDNSNTLDLITGGLAVLILLGGMVMMFTTVFTTKR
ncbi:hypothetical protein B7O87_01885 [Cylindrospermopsis raciborskii CENA303]|uniref:Uncharacterized protein n=1 Tax=Cylindrospermopsis raciborskii CENA303 TaxID=1170769 RepID=A0A1X4GIZ6_9CYAN|nr:hypothetical protein [Cylindrospermopsis raciborskii]OSO97030.1 hypothetical protein B7O87_01885 [Cylindrospermopsis raciborskii CENA303]